MAKEHTFDISAKVDMQEIKNAINQAQKEIANRFDFKDDKVKEIDLSEKDKKITITAVSENKLDAMVDMLKTKLIKREISSKALREKNREDASGGHRRAFFAIVDTISQDDAKVITKAIKDSNLKVQASIQGDEVRVKGKSIDDLQEIIAHLRSLELDIPLSFGNFR